MPAPIVLFIYNRAEHTAQTLQALAANTLATGSDLIVFADGAKKPEHEPSVAAAREVVRSVSGFKSVEFIERDQNRGLANSIIGGVTDICERYGRAIVVEDDLIVSPSFLTFVNAGLDRYASDADVLQISGYAYPVDGIGLPPNYFLPMISCWGWGIWARAWKKFDPSMQALAQLEADAAARRRFNLDGNYDYYGMACDQRDGRVDSWGVRWQLSLFANEGLVLYPRDSLVFNAGTDASGTHGAGHAIFQDATAAKNVWASGMWPEAVVHDEAFGRVKRLLAPHQPTLLRKIMQRIRR